MKQTTLDNERISSLDVARGEIYEKGRKSTNTSHIQKVLQNDGLHLHFISLG